jgi:glycosyltransferase involved in cell wall biosynthesis
MGRGIQLAIQAIPAILLKLPSFVLAIVGQGYAEAQLRIVAEHTGVAENIMWLGWRNHADMLRLVMASKIGLIPHIVNEHKNTTVPNKIFDYMAVGIPVVSSDALPLKRIIEETNCGLVFENNNTSDLAAKILAVSQSKISFGENGKKAVLKQYNWRNDEQALINAVERFGRKVDTPDAV